MIKKKGFTLLEVTIVLGIGTLIAFMKFQDMRNDQEAVLADNVGTQIKQLGEAVNRYISIRYDKISTLSSSNNQSSDPGPRTCSAAGCEITYQTLINEGLLPVGYTGTNAQKASYKIVLKRSGTAPDYVINGLITTASPWEEGGRIRYDLLGKAVQAAGVDGGMSRNTKIASGYGGQWSENSNSYSNITGGGLLAYRVGYNSSMYSVYLRRDGTLPMTGDLNLGGKSIKNIKDMTASGTTTTGALKTTGNASVASDLSVGGTSTLNGPVNINNNLKVKSDTYLNTLSTTGLAKFGSRIATNGLNPNDLPAGWAGGVRTYDLYASGNLTAGTIKSNGTIESTGRIKAGEYLHLNGQATLNAKCTPNGLVGRDSTGRVLSCVSGKWQTASGDGLKGIFITITDQTSGYKCVIPNSDTGACACPGSMYDSRYGFLSGTLIAEYDERRCSGSKNEHCYSNFRRLYACK
ncbi:TPA: shufflon system plasmid conjugative transfer pilus tip adhesin PilV [Escherichia coli]|uniref:shufflon system plasmid conjugative transfer pilus tip adhesin PilV n=1 Tax=Escherichia coli TaxID=562 RepID=UPI00037D9662|nr:shufflon system plasmid conjugative transfer pilus tip adhesin PilV [Escherichia coli]EAA0682555.1 prepilin-type cleavage/methylation domain-containing protein [Escherichia coli]EKI6904391.1 shufflon system plasmid conjugative transfer pilus tip adhesin PilV [Escherichia coli]KUT58684.1 pilus assembly protein PilV [Escherichia coli]MBI9303376.1 shufflon system plasmid conjugative transfer pilus tip adhesin PilV [Escherichia coli]MCN3494272.1 shufflon system plasmid conjugative transfer pilu